MQGVALSVRDQRLNESSGVRTQEANITGNKSAILEIAEQIQAWEERRDKEIALLMEIVHHQKQEIVELKIECIMPRHNVNNLISCQNMAYSMAHLPVSSSANKEEEMMQQQLEVVEMEPVEQCSVSTELKLY
jgi:hypothetical protein